MKEKKKKPSSQRKDINKHKQNKIKVINKAVIETNGHISLARKIKRGEFQTSIRKSREDKKTRGGEEKKKKKKKK